MEALERTLGARPEGGTPAAESALIAHRESFHALYAAARDSLYRTLLVTTRNPELAEDAVHEAFARALADWERVSAHPNPTAWLARVAMNQATSWWRLRRRERRDPPDRAAVADERPVDAALVRLVWELPRRQREVVALRILLDQNTEVTGRVLGIAPGTVTAHLHRALAQLRSRLTEADIEELTHA